MPQTDSPAAYETFLLRSSCAGGLVLGLASATAGSAVEAQVLGQGGIDAQLFQGAPIPEAPTLGQLLHVASGLALSLTSDESSLCVQPADATNPLQHWQFDAEGRLHPQATVQASVTVAQDQVALQGTDSNNSAQVFEQFDPTDFILVRHSWSGHYLTANPDSSVSWAPLQSGFTDAQMWGVTNAGELVNRGTGAVLQGPAAPAGQVPLSVGVATAADDPAHPQQVFNLMSMDGTASWSGATGFVVGASGDSAVLQPAVPADPQQILEPITPYQFFGLQNQVGIGGTPPYGFYPWLSRSGNSAIMVAAADWSPTGLFTVSRYGELISQVDGFVLQGGAQGSPVTFVDPAPDPIGFDTTTYSYVSADETWGALELRSQAPLGLICMAEGAIGTPIMWPVDFPPAGVQAWALNPAPGNPFTSDVDVAREFFCNPAPLPTDAPDDPLASPEAVALVAGDLDKTVRVIGTLVLGVLDIAAGWSPAGSAATAVERIATIVLGEASVAAKVAVVMQGTVTAASIVAVADGITKAGLWWQIFKIIVPNSFWGWALTVAKLSLSIIQWLSGAAGWAIKGAKLALLVATIAQIIGDGAPDEAALIAAHVAHLEAQGSAQT